MDVYSQLQEKLDDISHRFAHEARYFQVCAPPRAEGSEKVFDPIEDPPYAETTDTLAQRAQVSAHAIVALNVQVEQLLGMLPGEEGGEEEQMRELAELVRENEEAGAAVRSERAKVQAVLGKVRRVMGDVSEKKGDPEIQEEWCRLAGVDPAEVAARSRSGHVKVEVKVEGGVEAGAAVESKAAAAAPVAVKKEVEDDDCMVIL